MRITRKQLVHEIADETGYTYSAVKKVMLVMQRLVYNHMKNMDEVHLFDGINLSGVIKKGHMHHSEYGGDFEMPDYIGPKATFSEGLRYYMRGLKGYRDYDKEYDDEEEPEEEPVEERPDTRWGDVDFGI